MKIPTIKPEWMLYGVGAGLLLVMVNALLSGRIATEAAKSVARLPSDLIYGGAEGLFGLPDTRTNESESKCAAALASGDDWAASFYCPAMTWGRGVFDGK